MILERLSIQDRDALDVFVGNGMSFYESDLEDWDLQWDDGVYRVKTDEDREQAREENDKWRLENPGLASLMSSYLDSMTDSLFASPFMPKTLHFNFTADEAGN